MVRWVAMRIFQAIRAFFRILFDGEYAERERKLLLEEYHHGPAHIDFRLHDPDHVLERREDEEDEPEPEKAPPPPPPPPPEPPKLSPELANLQVLALLQREGRLLDFLKEDIDGIDDDQVGAAVRTIHKGCRKVLSENVTLAPIRKEREGSVITVPAGFDPAAIRLIGNVRGEPPFKGALKHHGWQVTKLNLPTQATGVDPKIVAPAEVEVR